jgi:hypothetical protein
MVYFQAYIKSKFGSILDGIAMEDVGIFYGHLVNFTAIWYIVWPLGIFVGYLLYISPFLVCCSKKNLATLTHTAQSYINTF